MPQNLREPGFESPRDSLNGSCLVFPVFFVAVIAERTDFASTNCDQKRRCASGTHKGPLTITELQDKVLLASGSMTAAVDRLEKRRLLLRKSSPSDRRARVLELTREGRRLVESCFGLHARDLEQLMSVLSSKEKTALYSSLKKIGLRAAQIAEDQAWASRRGKT
jgi:DNA-binding MarR family transcriptional regulator